MRNPYSVLFSNIKVPCIDHEILQDIQVRSRLLSCGMMRARLDSARIPGNIQAETVTVPAVGGIKQEMTRITVVLPAPFGPKKTETFP